MSIVTLVLSSFTTVWNSNLDAENALMSANPSSESMTATSFSRSEVMLLFAICRGIKGILPIGAYLTSIRYQLLLMAVT